MKILCKSDYIDAISATRNERMKWWREARFGMFIHFGLYSQWGRHEWTQVCENIPVDEYAKLADSFNPKPGAPREWAALAKKAGMKYMVLTTRHHEGFSLWDSKANPFNSVNYGPKRDIVREFVDACREFGLKIGFYSSMMDWHHPDSWKCAYDPAARKRFNDYIEALNTELLTNYGKIDILWYDVSRPMESPEGWNSLELNQKMRSLQPHIIINNRSQLEEDFSTPEEHVTATDKDWEACMTFNGLSWGYMDSGQTKNFSYTPHQIVKMLNTCASGGGNLLLNIGPKPDGSVPEDAVEPLIAVGDWLSENGDAVYGRMTRNKDRRNPSFRGNGVCGASKNKNSIYLWNWVWPSGGTMAIGGYMTSPKSVRYVKTGESIDFEYKDQRIILKNLPLKPLDEILGITVMLMEFDSQPDFVFASKYPQLHGGKVY